MEKKKSQSWRVMADYSCGLWDDQGYGVRLPDDEINAPTDFVTRFEVWLDKYYDNLEEGKLDVASFNREGRALAVELKQIVGSNVRVTYVHEKSSDTPVGSDSEEIV